MQIFSNDNSYFADGNHYVNELSVPSQLIYYLGNNEEYVTTDVYTSPDNIDRLTRNGGFFLGNAMQLKSICPVNPDNYNVTNPLPAVNGLQISAGPANATTKSFYEYCAVNAQNSAACEQTLADRLIDGAIGVAIGAAAVSIPWCIATVCLCIKARRAGYKDISDKD